MEPLKASKILFLKKKTISEMEGEPMSEKRFDVTELKSSCPVTRKSIFKRQCWSSSQMLLLIKNSTLGEDRLVS